MGAVDICYFRLSQVGIIVSNDKLTITIQQTKIVQYKITSPAYGNISHETPTVPVPLYEYHIAAPEMNQSKQSNEHKI